MLTVTIRSLVVTLPLLVLATNSAAGQNPCDYEPYGPGCYWSFYVSPQPDSVPLASQGIAYFNVVNSGTNFEIFTLTCSSSGGVSCVHDQGGVNLFGGSSYLIGVTFSSSGPGALALTASGQYSSWSESGTTTIYDPYLIWLSASPHNGYNQSVALCEFNCFNAVLTYSTPSYLSLGSPRSVTLLYSSRQAHSRHTIVVNGGAYAANPPEKFSLRLQRSDGSWVMFTNGSTEIFFQGAAIAQMGVQFDDASLGTGAYYYTVVLKAYWGGTVRETSQTVRLLVLSERDSPYGAGWSVAGLERVVFGPSDSLITIDHAGTIQFWRRTSCTSNSCVYEPPSGEFDKLERLGLPTEPLFITYVRTRVDGSKLTFDWSGRCVSSDDVFGNRTRYVWRYNDSERLDSIIDPVGKAIVFGYDGSNRLSLIRDVVGNRTSTFTIDAQNNLTDIQDPVGGHPLSLVGYDSDHRLISWKDRRGSSWKRTYDFAGRIGTDSTPPVTADGLNQRLVTTYAAPETKALVDPASGTGTSTVPAPARTDTTRVASLTPPGGSVRLIRVDAFGALLEVLAPSSEYALYTRNSAGQVTEARNSSGWVAMSWNGPRVISRVNQITGAATYYEWNAGTNRLTRQYGARAPEIRYFYDVAGLRLDSMRVGVDTPGVKYTYDVRGRVLTARDSKGHLTTSYYSSSGLFTLDSTRMGSRRIGLFYDGIGRIVATQDAANRIDSIQYDSLNRVIRTASSLGSSTSYGYRDSLNLTKVTDALGQIFGIEKNLIGWDTAGVDPTGRRDTYGLSRTGQVLTWTNRRGQSTSYVYDADGRLIRRTLSDGRATKRTYSTTSIADSSAEGSDTLRWLADTVYQIAVRGGVAHRVRRFYNGVSRYSTIDLWRDGQSVLQVRNDLDTLGRVWRIAVPGTSNRDTLRYTPDGLLKGIGLHGISTATYLYRSGHDLAALQYSPNQFEFGRAYANDSLGRNAEMVAGSSWALERYDYDSLDRLQKVERWSTTIQCTTGDTLSEFGARCYPNRNQLLSQTTLSFDLVGNRTDASAIVSLGDRLARFNGDSMLYDSDGNLTRRFRIADSVAFNQRLYWNSAGELDSARTVRQGVSQVAKFGYDFGGRRVRKTVGNTTKYYIYDGNDVVAEYDGSGSLQRHYTYYPGTDYPHSVAVSGTRLYFIADGHGNVSGLIGPYGGGTAVFAKYRYTPSGEADSTYEFSITNNVRFAGRELDPETGLYYNRARYYDPQLGRFVSEDPLGILGGINPYTYADNDPVNQRDPSGLCPFCIPIVLGGAAEAGVVAAGATAILAFVATRPGERTNSDAFQVKWNLRSMFHASVLFFRVLIGLPPGPQRPKRWPDQIRPFPLNPPPGEVRPPPPRNNLPPGVNLGLGGGGDVPAPMVGGGTPFAEVCHYEATYERTGNGPWHLVDVQLISCAAA